MNHLCTAALEIGLPVFPCRADKRPLTRHGFKDASAEPDVIRAVFRDSNAVLIGVPTGEPSGLTVVDIDPAGMAWYDDCAQFGWWGLTRMHQTPRRGLHIIYVRDPAAPLPNSAGKLHRGVDIRGDGGYVIWPPSPGYRVLVNVPPAPMPPWIVSKLLLPAAQRTAIALLLPVSRDIEKLDAWVRASPEGERNGRLFWAACRAGADAEQLVSAGVSAGLAEREVRATIRSAMRQASWADFTSLPPSRSWRGENG